MKDKERYIDFNFFLDIILDIIMEVINIFTYPISGIFHHVGKYFTNCLTFYCVSFVPLSQNCKMMKQGIKTIFILPFLPS